MESLPAGTSVIEDLLKRIDALERDVTRLIPENARLTLELGKTGEKRGQYTFFPRTRLPWKKPMQAFHK